MSATARLAIGPTRSGEHRAVESAKCSKRPARFEMKKTLPAAVCVFLLLPVATEALAQSHPQQVGVVTALFDRRTGKDFVQAMMMSGKFAIVKTGPLEGRPRPAGPWLRKSP